MSSQGSTEVSDASTSSSDERLAWRVRLISKDLSLLRAQLAEVALKLGLEDEDTLKLQEDHPLKQPPIARRMETMMNTAPAPLMPGRRLFSTPSTNGVMNLSQLTGEPPHHRRLRKNIRPRIYATPGLPVSSNTGPPGS